MRAAPAMLILLVLGMVTAAWPATASARDVAFAPPEHSIIEVSATAGAPFVARLVDPEGRVRDAQRGHPDEPVRLSAIALPPGEWRVHVEGAAGERIAGDVRVAFVRVAATLTLSPRNLETLALVAQSRPGENLRVDIRAWNVRDPAEALQAGADTGHMFVQKNGFSGTATDWIATGRGVDRVLAANRGVLPEDVVLRLPYAGVGEAPGDSTRFASVQFQAAGGNLTYGLAMRTRLHADVFLAWSGATVPDVQLVSGGTAHYLTAAHFDGAGASVVAGPIQVVEDVAAQVTLPHDVSLVFAEGATPLGALGATSFQVQGPGVLDEVGGGDAFYFGTSPSRAGTWDFTLRHASGHEDGRLRVVAASFPLPR